MALVHNRKSLLGAGRIRCRESVTLSTIYSYTMGLSAWGTWVSHSHGPDSPERMLYGSWWFETPWRGYDVIVMKLAWINPLFFGPRWLPYIALETFQQILVIGHIWMLYDVLFMTSTHLQLKWNGRWYNSIHETQKFDIWNEASNAPCNIIWLH